MVVFLDVTIQDIQGQKFVVQVQNDAQVLGLKLQIWEARSIAPESQRLVFAGRQLQDEETLSLAGVQSGSVIFMVQQNEQTQAVVPQPATVQPAPVYTPVVQAQQPVVQPMNVAQPQVVVAPNVANETCCCCMPLRTGALVILILSVLTHLAMAPGTIWLGLIGLAFDALGIFGWYKHDPKKVMVWVWFEGISLVLSAIYGVVMMIFFEVTVTQVGGHHHHGHGHHGDQGAPTNAPQEMGSSTTTMAPHKLTGSEKAFIGVAWTLGILIVVAIQAYFIRAVYRYVKQMRQEGQGAQAAHGMIAQPGQAGPRPQAARPVTTVVNGVAYQQV